MGFRTSRTLSTLLTLVIASGSRADAQGATICVQAPDRIARTLRVDSAFTVTGAGIRRSSDGSVMYVWTGTDCAAWIMTRGPVDVRAPWSSVSVPLGALFVAHEEGPAGTREYRQSHSGDGTMTIGGTMVPIDDRARGWVADAVQEYVRRSGADGAARAEALMDRGGLDSLMGEVRRVATASVRVRYLTAAFTRVDARQRGSFVRRAAETLDQGRSRAEFLLSIPVSWRGDEGVIASAYEAGSTVGGDDFIETLLGRIPTPRPTSPLVMASLRRLVGAVDSPERREILRKRVLEAP
jgi:hypothetical protein